MNSFASVSLVGAGPGDPELITVRGRNRLAEADVVIYDDLAGGNLLEYCRSECERIYVGKRCGRHSRSQAEITALLLERARTGCRVVRLKGGDPFIFGRGGEELSALLEAGIPCEVVPGVTAAAAAGAAAGIPLTHREISSAVIFVTGHETPGKAKSGLDWRKYARLRATICIYMGGRRLPRIAQSLIAGGMDPGTSVALVSRASQPDEALQFLSLVELSTRPDLELPAPVIAVVGEVAGIPTRVRMLATACDQGGSTEEDFQTAER